jgi:5,10-methylenetetrahydromethanopterin reductase
MEITLGIRLAPIHPHQKLVEAAAQCERAGFDAAWVTDTPLIAGRWGDPYVCLALMAEGTKHLRLATGVTNPYMRHFPAVAAAGASLHDLSGGRFILGIGAGNSAARALGFSQGKLGRLREFTRALRTLFREGACTFDDMEQELHPPRPVPVYVAAMGPKTIEFAGAEADGVIFNVGASIKTLEWAMEILRKGAEKAGRDVSEIEVIAAVHSAAGQDRAMSIRRVRPLIGLFYHLAPHVLEIAGFPNEATKKTSPTNVYPDITHALDLDEASRATEFIPDEVVNELALIGTPDKWVSRLLMMEELGVNHVQIRGPESYSMPDPEISYCRDEIIPRLRQAR